MPTLEVAAFLFQPDGDKKIKLILLTVLRKVGIDALPPVSKTAYLNAAAPVVTGNVAAVLAETLVGALLSTIP